MAKGKIIKKDKKNDPQNTTQKTKNWANLTLLYTGIIASDPDILVVHAPLVTPIMHLY